MFTYLLNSFHVWTAGSWPLIFHWGLAIGVIILLSAALVGSYFIPVLGQYLTKFRMDILIAIGVIALMQGIFVWGTHTEAKRCKAQIVVVEKIVTKAASKATSKSTKTWKDPYDNPAN